MSVTVTLFGENPQPIIFPTAASWHTNEVGTLTVYGPGTEMLAQFQNASWSIVERGNARQDAAELDAKRVRLSEAHDTITAALERLGVSLTARVPTAPGEPGPLLADLIAETLERALDLPDADGEE
jgi:hypothetical protein